MPNQPGQWFVQGMNCKMFVVVVVILVITIWHILSWSHASIIVWKSRSYGRRLCKSKKFRQFSWKPGCGGTVLAPIYYLLCQNCEFVLHMLAQLGYSAEINEIYELSRLFAAPCRPGNCRTSHNLLNVTSLKYFVINWLTGGVYVWCWSKRVPVCSRGKCGNGSGFGSALFSAVKHWRSAICHWFVVSDVGAKRCQ